MYLHICPLQWIYKSYKTAENPPTDLQTERNPNQKPQTWQSIATRLSGCKGPTPDEDGNGFPPSAILKAPGRQGMPLTSEGGEAKLARKAVFRAKLKRQMGSGAKAAAEQQAPAAPFSHRSLKPQASIFKAPDGLEGPIFRC